MLEDKITTTLYSFIALWDSNFGPQIEAQCPKQSSFNLESIASDIFLAYNNFYRKEESDKIDRIIFNIPLNRIERRAKILIDISAGSQQPFILVLLLPDYLTEERMKIFDDLMIKIGNEFKVRNTSPLDNYYEDLNKLLEIEERVQDSEIKIDDTYTFTSAVQDFKAGIELFKSKNLDEAYHLLRKSNLKFEFEKNLKLTLETSYLLGSLLAQSKKYRSAEDYFDKLEILAEDMQHQKYLESAIFMRGFCAYKNQDYYTALEQFKKLQIRELQFVNKLQYNSLFGRVLINIEEYDQAEKQLQKALDISNSLNDSEEVKQQKAQLFYELGDTHYKATIKKVRQGQLSKDSLNQELEKAIWYFDNATDIWRYLEKYKNLIYTYKLIGNIHESLGDTDEFLSFYEKALNIADKINDVMSKLKIFGRIVQTQARLGLHNENIARIDQMIANIGSNAFMDLFTIAGLHMQLGDSLLKIGNHKEALSEFLITLNIFNRFQIPVQDVVIVIEKIMSIYTQRNDSEHFEYYNKQLERIKEQMEEISVKERKELLAIRIVREVWIFQDTGIQLFSHAPETELDSDLLGGFITAMQNFTLELTSKQLNSMIIGMEVYMFYRESDKPYFIMGRANQKAQFVNIENVLKIFYQRFWKEYKSVLTNFNGNIVPFRSFLEIIENIEYSE